MVAGGDHQDDGDRHVEVEVGPAEEHREGAVRVRAHRRERHQEIHVRLASAKAHVGATQDGVSRIKQDNGGEHPHLREQVQPRDPAQIEEGLVAEVGGIQENDVPQHRHHPEEAAADQEPDDRVVALGVWVGAVTCRVPRDREALGELVGADGVRVVVDPDRVGGVARLRGRDARLLARGHF